MAQRPDDAHRPDTPIDLRRQVPADPPPPRTMTGGPVEPHPEDPSPGDGRQGRRSGRGLRDPGGALGGVVACVAILAIAGFIFLTHNLSARTLHNLAPSAFPAPTAVTLDRVPSPDMQFVLTGRYLVGASELLGAMPPTQPGDPTGADMANSLLEQIDAFAGSDPARLLRAAVVAAEVAGPGAALDRIEKEEDALAEAPDPPLYTEEIRATLRADAAALRQALSAGPDALPADLRDGLVDRHGWFGRLALAYGLDDADPSRAGVMADTQRTLWALIGGVTLAGAAVLVGIVLFIVALVMLGSGRLRMRYSAPAPGGSAYVEVFAFFLMGFLGVSLVAQGIAASGGPDLSTYLVWVLLIFPGWALVRGARTPEWRAALGWHTGRGVFREIGAGVVGYLAGLPIALVGIGLTLVLLALAGFLAGPGDEAVQPTHPVMERLAQGSVPAILGVYLLACVWAPLTEETFFRGALYHHLRGRTPSIIAGLVTAVLFASIHPQGWVAIPALASLGFVFAMLREWRGSLIAPIVAHAINNGFIMTLLVLAIG
ncbi:MAG: CPBP family intramembrane glutamic endopeptidase [Phycisphaerales bacterium]